jgi:hypothetical protein
MVVFCIRLHAENREVVSPKLWQPPMSLHGAKNPEEHHFYNIYTVMKSIQRACHTIYLVE